MTQANVFDAMGQSYNALQGAFQDGARTRAGRAYASGDREATINALGGAGLIGEAAAVDDRWQRQDERMQDRQRQAQAERAEFMLNATRTLRRIPSANRAQAYQQLRPVLEQFLPPEVVTQIDQADLSDTSLDAFAGALGQEAERLQLFSTRAGIVGVGQGPDGPTTQMIYETPAETPDAPQGYRWTAENTLEAIPGGPADPRVAGGLAASRRAPPRARSGGGGGGSRSSGGSAPASRPSGRPWERY